MVKRLDIIFDLGGVVVAWQPEAVIAAHFQEPKLQARVLQEFVQHADWIALDRGTLARQTAIERAARRIGVTETEVGQLLEGVPSALVAMPEMVALLYRLKDQGHRLYCLSNMHHAFIEHLEKAYDFWTVFTDIVVSCRVQLCKPEAAIFEHLLSKNALDPTNTLFIDDTAVNITAAAALGIQTLQFESPAQCEGHLKALGFIN